MIILIDFTLLLLFRMGSLKTIFYCWHVRILIEFCIFILEQSLEPQGPVGVWPLWGQDKSLQRHGTVCVSWVVLLGFRGGRAIPSHGGDPGRFPKRWDGGWP